MLDAYESGLDGQATLSALSTYLGHADPKATYWYLSEVSGIASGGRETAGHQVAVVAELRSAP
jgi:integrase/recombinase XerD